MQTVLTEFIHNHAVELHEKRRQSIDAHKCILDDLYHIMCISFFHAVILPYRDPERASV